MSARYAPLPNPRSADDADRELRDAFEESDNEDDDEGRLDTENTPLTRASPLVSALPQNIPGTYDFERDYDYPPPGSPPRPSAAALPNDYGNSNGYVPTSPIEVASGPRPSFFRRAVGAILPTHYARIPSESVRSRGGGVENDGVFANVMAKPGRAVTVMSENGDVHMVPEEQQAEAPPSYNVAQADAVPQYWETTVHAPAWVDPFHAEMIVDDLPSGSLFVFSANLFVSFFFQFVGFLLTYLLHTSHAAKYGSRAGLGLTLIQYGFYSRNATFGPDPNVLQEGDTLIWPTDPSNPSEIPTAPFPDAPDTTVSVGTVTSRDWLSFLLMTIGWFLLLSSFVGFWRVKRWEKSIRATSTPAPISPEDIERDIAVRRNIEQVFGLGDRDSEEVQGGTAVVDGQGNVVVIPDQRALEEARLTRDLRAAGLL